MPENTKTLRLASIPESLARLLSRLGWTGFWIQLLLIAVPILLLIYVMFFSGPDSAQSKGVNLSHYLSYGGLLVMLFTTVWFYRYTCLASRITGSQRPAIVIIDKHV